MSRFGTPLRAQVAVLALLTVALVILADFLFYGHRVGWTLGLFTAALVAALWMRSGPGRSRLAATCLSLAVLGVAATMAEEPGALEVIVGLVLLGMLAMTLRGGWRGPLAHWPGRLASLPLRLPFQAIIDSTRMRRFNRRHSGRGIRGAVRAGGLIGWIAPLVFGGIFIALFAAANPIIEAWVDRVGGWFNHVPDLIEPGRIFLWVAIALGVWGLLRARARYRRVQHAAIALAPGIDIARFTPVDFVVRSLLVFNVIFAAQTVLDAVYLWGGAELPEGMTYAQYAHRGAYPLLAATLLAALLVLISFRPGAAAEQSRAARSLVYLWLVQNVLLVASSVWRLGLYIEAYQLTRWRIAAAIWMAVVAIGVIWIMLRIITRRSNAWLIGVNLATAAVVCYAAMFINFDRIIADFNVRHCRELVAEGGPLDVDYLRELGPESIPALRWFIDRLPGTAVAARAQTALAALELDLHESLKDWRGWTYRRSRLAPSLNRRGTEAQRKRSENN